jgi:large subunit ribosomal protein L23
VNPERLTQVLIEPRISEKATRAADIDRQYVFKVLSDATKAEIKAAVEELFSVKVSRVQVANVPARVKRFRGGVGVRSGWKKAYVKLEPGFDIDFMGAD